MGSDGQRDRNYDVSFYNPDTRSFDVSLHLTPKMDFRLPFVSQVFLEYLQHEVSRNDTFHFVQKLPWPSADGALPPDEPRCGYRDNKCQINSLPPGILATAVVVPVVFFMIIAVIAAVVFVKLW